MDQLEALSEILRLCIETRQDMKRIELIARAEIQEKRAAIAHEMAKHNEPIKEKRK